MRISFLFRACAAITLRLLRTANSHERKPRRPMMALLSPAPSFIKRSPNARETARPQSRLRPPNVAGPGVKTRQTPSQATAPPPTNIKALGSIHTCITRLHVDNSSVAFNATLLIWSSRLVVVRKANSSKTSRLYACARETQVYLIWDHRTPASC